MNPAWQPTAHMVDHLGHPLAATKQFPWSPPAEIGEVLSADSNVSTDKRPSFVMPWIILLVMWLAIYLGLGEILPRVVQGKGDPQTVRLGSIGIGLFCGLVSLLWTWPKGPYCTYVGSLGAAMIEGRWGQKAPRKLQVLVFRNAQVLYADALHVYENFIYQETRFVFSWLADRQAKPLLNVGGEHQAHQGTPPAEHPINFGQRVEQVWSEHLLRGQPSLGETSFAAQPELVFPTRHSPIREIRLQRDAIKFVYEDRVETVPLTDLANVETKRGLLEFTPHDAGWFSSQGKFRLTYGQLGNARVFLHHLESLLRAKQPT
jgi:hypothetical protein